MTMLMRLLMCIGLMMSLSCCQPNYHWRGNYVKQTDLEKIELGKTTKQELVKLLGAPTHKQLFAGGGWYYIGEETKSVSFLKPTLLNRQVILISFNNKDCAQSISIKDKLEDVEIDIVEDKTPTLGRDPGFFKEVFGAVGKYDEGKHRAGYA